MKKIISIIVLCIVGILVVGTVTLAIVPVSTYDAINGATKDGDEPYAVTVYRDGAVNYYGPTNPLFNKVSKKIMSLYNESLKASVMSSFFQGAMSYEENVEKVTTSNIDNVLKTAGSVYVEFKFDYVSEEPVTYQTLHFEGEEYTVQTNNNKTTNVEFTSLAVEVKDTESFDDVTIYVIKDNGSSKSCYYKIHTLAHQSELYDYILSLTIKGTLTE